MDMDPQRQLGPLVGGKPGGLDLALYKTYLKDLKFQIRPLL